MADSSAGICETRPSPMVRMPYRCTASPAVKPIMVTPMMMPATMLMPVMMRPAMASALHELHGAVHRAEELRLAVELGAPVAGFVQVEGSSSEVGVDGHLLAGHGVEGEAGGDLGDALGALGDDQELDDGQDEEDDHADHEVAANQNLRTIR